MKITESIIGKTLLIGVIFSAVLVIYGMLALLYQYGSQPIANIDLKTQLGISFTALWHGLYINNPLAYIVLGVFVLLFTQVTRVFVTILLFISKNEMTLA